MQKLVDIEQINMYSVAHASLFQMDEMKPIQATFGIISM